MPLKLLKMIKKNKLGKLKKRSKSSADIFQQSSTEIFRDDFQEMPVPDVVPTVNTSTKAKSKSRLRLFSIGKEDSDVTFKNTKNEKKNKRNSILLESGKSELAFETAVNRKESTVSTNSQGKSDPNLFESYTDNSHVEAKAQTKRCASCVTFGDVTNRERRLSDIAQLDNYIEYYQRRGTDDGSIAKRLCCAQMLLTGLLRAEQMPRNGVLRSQDKLNNDTSASNLNVSHSSTSASNLNVSHSSTSAPKLNVSHSYSHLYHKNKLSPKYRSAQWSFSPNGYRHSISDDGSRRASWVLSDDSEDKDEDGPIQFTCNPSLDTCNSSPDTDGGVSGHSSRRQSGSSDSFVVRDFIKKPKFMSKRRSVPVLTSEIEIF